MEQFILVTYDYIPIFAFRKEENKKISKDSQRRPDFKNILSLLTGFSGSVVTSVCTRLSGKILLENTYTWLMATLPGICFASWKLLNLPEFHRQTKEILHRNAVASFTLALLVAVASFTPALL